MNDADRALVELAARQRGVFTRAQAHDLGINTSDVGYRIRQGRLVPCGSHTLTFAGVALDWRAQLMAGLLDLGQEALVSGSAAAAPRARRVCRGSAGVSRAEVDAQPDHQRCGAFDRRHRPA